MSTLTGVRGDDGENEWRSRLVGDIEAVFEKRTAGYSTYMQQFKYIEVSNDKAWACVDCGALVHYKDVHDRNCNADGERKASN